MQVIPAGIIVNRKNILSRKLRVFKTPINKLFMNINDLTP